MTPRSEKAPDFKSVASGGTATCDLDLGWKYNELMLEASVAAGDEPHNDIIEDMWWLVNGAPVRSHTSEELNAIQAAMDEDLAIKTSGSIAGGDLVSYIPLPLAETWRKDVGRGKLLGWNANGIRSLQLKVKLRAVTSPSLRLWIASREPADERVGFGPITKWKRDDHPATGTPQSYSDIFDIGGRQANFLQSLHLFPTTGTARYVNNAKLTLSEKVYFDREYLMNQAIMQGKGWNPDGAAVPRFDIALDESDFMDDPLDLSQQRSQKLELTFNAAPAGNIRIIRIETGMPELG